MHGKAPPVRHALRKPRHVAFVVLVVASMMLGLVGMTLAIITPSSSALTIAQSIASSSVTVTGASFAAVPPSGTPNGVSTSVLGGFPLDGADYGILTSGDVNSVDDPGTFADTDDGGENVRGNTDLDVSILKIDLTVPQGANCLSFNFKFLSEEFPEFVGTSFNDAFIAELDTSDWTTSGSTISAPHNFAFDSSNEVVSINSTGIGGMTAANGAGTAFDGTTTSPDADPNGGATVLLGAATPVTSGAHSLYLSIFDQGDHALDSAVFLDNLRVGSVPNPAVDCKPGATQPAHLTLTKTVDNTGGGTAAPTDWTLSATGPTTISGTTGSPAVTDAVVSPGTYTLAETGPSGYTPTAWSCTGGSLTGSSLVLAANDNASCSISNVFSPGASADLSITKSGAPDPVTVGSELTYTVAVSNAGPDAAAGVTVTDTLPGTVTFVSATPSQGTCSGTATISCSLGTINASGSATVTITVIPTTDADLSNTASASATTADPNATNNADTELTVVNPGPPGSADLSVTKSGAPDPVTVGSELTYTVAVSNAGPDAAAGVTVTDTLPGTVTFVSATPSQGTCSGTATISCSLGTINASGSATVTIKVIPTTDADLSNTASASATTADPNAANNADTELTVVNPAPTETTASGTKYYDANANGQLDIGEVGLADWPIDYDDGTTSASVLADAGGSFTVTLDPGDYTFAERQAGSPWFQTGNTVDQSGGTADVTLNADMTYSVSFDAGETATGLNFGNLCVGGGGGRTIGFWGNKNGQALIGVDDLALLSGLNLVNEDGSAFDPTTAAQVRDWLRGARGWNMAYMLSAQLAAMALNVHNGFVLGSALVYAPDTTSANAAGFATVAALMAEANAELGLHPTAFAGDAWRVYQEALKDALDSANNNLTFVQADASTCPAPFEEAP
jgi:uncharacterized repeat protein (TIGR01451 family)